MDSLCGWKNVDPVQLASYDNSWSESEGIEILVKLSTQSLFEQIQYSDSVSDQWLLFAF